MVSGVAGGLAARARPASLKLKNNRPTKAAMKMTCRLRDKYRPSQMLEITLPLATSRALK